NLTEGDILREVVNSVGKQGKLGAHIRCVVSVSMLTEGWDANTVTHICGVRAFGSQLLCEQVAGRALRRKNYELVAYTKDGEEIPYKDRKRYKKENIVWKFPPEYAHIIGVPFKTFKGGGAGTPPPSKPKTIIKALPERKEMEIVFPNIVGYRSESRQGRITADFEGLPKFKIDFNKIPEKTTLATPVGDEVVVLKSDFREMRDAHVVYVLTQWLIREKYTDHEKGREFQRFGQLKAIVQQWYDSKIEVLGGDGSPEMRRLVCFMKQNEVATSIYEGIKHANADEEKITAILNYYNPKGSSKYVFGATSKEVYPTQKSHVNYVVCDTDSWEQIAAKTLEELPQVKHYVKNHFLDFKIPYLDGTVERNYMTDFIAVVETPKGETVNLIIEISGFSNDRYGNKDLKRYYTETYWIPAANNLSEFGRWEFIEISDIDNIKATLIDKINQL
ncbi:MAG: restriction endonuclease subunit R, partial [Bacteroidaceae bacterium]|nr:restriction endonuclease subunit R [Bacteroidaceae bacterium]